MSFPSNIRIADVQVSILGCTVDENWFHNEAYDAFCSNARPDITLRLHQEAQRSDLSNPVFECAPVWTLYRDNNCTTIEIHGGDTVHGEIHSLLCFSKPIQQADLYLTQTSTRSFGPFFGPTLELLFLHYLCRGKGIIMHACGIERNGGGILFVGDSGAGKSTLARLWDQRNGGHILSDDRIVLRKSEEGFWIYGTPWHGDAKFASPRKAPLKKIFFLEHGRVNSLADLPRLQAVSNLLTASFPPHWDAGGMAFSLALLEELAGRIPCQRLAFQPDLDAIHFLEENIG